MNPLKIGTRGSQLALCQAQTVANLLPKSSICVIETQGDRDLTSPIPQIGGKGVFIKALQHALLARHVDIAVHSLKDMTSQAPSSLVTAGYLRPEACHDVVVFAQGQGSLDALPHGSVIGTGSLRRKALCQKIYPHLRVEPIRGNVLRRLELLKKGHLDAVMLSCAGLLRLGLAARIGQHLDPTQFIPAPGQGVIAIECRRQDASLRRQIEQISDPQQHKISTLERSFLDHVGFDCTLPLGLKLVEEAKGIRVWGFLSTPSCDGEYLQQEVFFSHDQASEGVLEVAQEFKGWKQQREGGW